LTLALVSVGGVSGSESVHSAAARVDNDVATVTCPYVRCGLLEERGCDGIRDKVIMVNIGAVGGQWVDVHVGVLLWDDSIAKL
jgi:hypothetical protein